MNRTIRISEDVEDFAIGVSNLSGAVNYILRQYKYNEDLREQLTRATGITFGEDKVKLPLILANQRDFTFEPVEEKELGGLPSGWIK